jgi:hypothetical protein
VNHGRFVHLQNLQELVEMYNFFKRDDEFFGIDNTILDDLLSEIELLQDDIISDIQNDTKE